MGYTEPSRVFRGGAFVVPLEALRPSIRYLNYPSLPGRVLGFRLVRIIGESHR